MDAEINDSGVYLPPSPPERKSFWSTNSSRSTTSTTNHRGLLNDNEQFSISRESFDSYRRSFDISARSPVMQAYDNGNGRPRASLDSRSFGPPLPLSGRASLDSRTFQPPPPRSSNSFTRPSVVPAQTTEERREDFEDVDIADKPVPAPKKRGLFSRITDSGVHSERPGSQDGGKGSAWHHFGVPGRRRGQSGQGAELGSIPKRETTTPKPESQLKRESQHIKQASVTDAQAPKTVGKEETPVNTATKPVEKQANAGAQQQAPTVEEPAKADSGVEVESGMKDISLDEAATPKAKQADEGLKALKPQNSQAPEIKST